MSLVNYYKANTYKFLTRKHQCTKKSEYLRRAKAIAFLEYCDSKGIKRIEDISLQDRDEFLEKLDRSEATKKLYFYAINEFLHKAHLL